MTPPSPWEREAAKATSEVARRAIRRLDMLEWVILAVTAMIAVAGGGLVAWLVVGRSAAGFRVTWIATSMLLLIVPGVVALVSHRREERKAQRRREARASEAEEDD